MAAVVAAAVNTAAEADGTVTDDGDWPAGSKPGRDPTRDAAGREGNLTTMKQRPSLDFIRLPGMADARRAWLQKGTHGD